MKALCLVALCALLAVGFSAQAAQKRPICTERPDLESCCFWTKGFANTSADAGYVITLQETGSYILDATPPALDRLLFPPRGSRAPEGYVAGDFLFCPLPAHIHPSADPQVFEWRFHGCVQDFKNATVVPSADSDLRRKLCEILDCSRPGFADLRQKELIYVVQPKKLEKDEAAIEFEVNTKNGVISGISDLPVGWTFSISNQPASEGGANTKTKVSGTRIVGALRADQLRKIHIHVRGLEYQDTVDIEGSMSAVVPPNLDTTKSIKLNQEDFSMVGWR